MRRLLSLVTLVLLALPAYAQDDFGGFGDSVLSASDIDALFGGGGNRNRNQNNNNIPDPDLMFQQMKDLLKTEKAPLSKDQEKALKPLLATEIQSMREYLETQFGNRGQNNQNNQNRGNQNNQATMISELFKEVAKQNTELLTAMKTELTPDQAALITKAEKDKKVCLVLMDLLNPQQNQNRGNDPRNRGGDFNRGGGVPIAFEGLDVFGDFGGGGGGGRGGRGGNNSWQQAMPDRPFCTNISSTTAQRLEPFSQVLTKGKKALTPEQEPKLLALIEGRMKLMDEELRKSNPQITNLLNDRNRNNQNNNQTPNPQNMRNSVVSKILQQLGIPNNNNNNNNRGGRGPNDGNVQNNNQNNPQANNQNNQGGRGNRGGNNFSPEAEIRAKNEELLDKIAASLNPPQGKIVKKYKYDQIKARGGVERYRAIMEEEGTPLTAEQRTQIQALFNSQNQGVRQYAEELAQKEIASKPLEQFLPPPPQQNQQQNPNYRPNPNNVDQNPRLQEIVADLLPEVSKRRAVLEKVTQDTIMKLLTPSQVASYKLNSL